MLVFGGFQSVMCQCAWKVLFGDSAVGFALFCCLCSIVATRIVVFHSFSLQPFAVACWSLLRKGKSKGKAMEALERVQSSAFEFGCFWDMLGV